MSRRNQHPGKALEAPPFRVGSPSFTFSCLVFVLLKLGDWGLIRAVRHIHTLRAGINYPWHFAAMQKAITLMHYAMRFCQHNWLAFSVK